MQKRLVTLALAMVLTPALALAQKTSYDYDKSANFTGFKTYALKDGTKVGQPLIDDRIVAALEAELAAKGLTKSDANPDLFVVYHVAFDKQKDISTYSSGHGGYGAYGWGYGGGWYRGGWYGGAGGMSTTSGQTSTIYIGQLAVDMYDSANHNLVWRGVASKTIDPKAKPEKQEKNLKKAVTKLLKNYPPPVKK